MSGGLSPVSQPAHFGPFSKAVIKVILVILIGHAISPDIVSDLNRSMLHSRAASVSSTIDIHPIQRGLDLWV